MMEKINELTEILGKIKSLYDVWEKEKAHNPNMAIYVYMIYASGPCTQAKLAARYGIPKQTLHSVISRLESDGYVFRSIGRKNRRDKQICLTRKGLTYAEKTAGALLKSEQKILEQMGHQKINILIDALNEYAVLLEKEIKNDTLNAFSKHGTE